jgi:hypothetical protein
MCCGVEVFCGVLVLGGVTATYMPAGEAKPQVDPFISGFEALFATACVRLYISNLVHVLTLFHVFVFPGLLNGIRTAKQVSPGCEVRLMSPWWFMTMR